MKIIAKTKWMAFIFSFAALIVLAFFPVAVNYGVMYYVWESVGSKDAWITFWGSYFGGFASLIGGAAAFVGVLLVIRQGKRDQRDLVINEAISRDIENIDTFEKVIQDWVRLLASKDMHVWVTNLEYSTFASVHEDYMHEMYAIQRRAQSVFLYELIGRLILHSGEFRDFFSIKVIDSTMDDREKIRAIELSRAKASAEGVNIHRKFHTMVKQKRINGRTVEEIELNGVKD